MEERLSLLLERYKTNQLSPSEWMELTEAAERRYPLENMVQQDLLGHIGAADPVSEETLDLALQRVLAVDKMQLPAAASRRNFFRTAWFRYAAILLLIAGTATFLYLNNTQPKETVKSQSGDKPVILQDRNRATLMLSDGSTIILDKATIGALAMQGSTKLVKLNSGSLAYNAGRPTGEVLYNTISTPKGSQYQIMLPDGSKVWLNAASSIRFPAAFGKDRKVTVTGEVYFEVVTDRNRPFSVTANGMDINVLGTSFNVNAYPDEPSVKTSLLQGSVRIDNITLKPGEAYRQGAITPTNLDQDLAWKNGVFDFDDKGLQEVMRQLSRWYDLDIRYEDSIPDIRFGGKMGRDVSLSSVLTFLEKGGVHFKLTGNGKTLVVTR